MHALIEPAYIIEFLEALKAKNAWLNSTFDKKDYKITRFFYSSKPN